MAEIAPFRLRDTSGCSDLVAKDFRALRGSSGRRILRLPRVEGELSGGAVHGLGQAQSKVPNHLICRVREA